MGSPLTKIGDMLSGFQADMSGQGVAYRDKREQRRLESGQDLDQARVLAMAEDARIVKGFIEAGKVDVGKKYLLNRAESIKRLKGDDQHTMGVYRQLDDGDIDGAMYELNAFIDGAQRTKVLDPAKVVSSNTLSNGTTIFGLDDKTTRTVDAAGNYLTGDAAAAAIPSETLTAAQKNLRDVYGKDTPEYKAALAAYVAKSGTTIHVGDKGAIKAAEKLAEINANRVSSAVTDGEAAEETLEAVRQMRSIDVNQGPSEPLKFALANGFAAFGIDTQELLGVDIGNVQSFQAIASSMINKVLNQAKGPQTEGDASRAASTIARLGNMPEANTFIMNTLEANALRVLERRDFLLDRIDNGKTSATALREWGKFKAKTPNLSDPSKISKNGLPIYFYQFKNDARQKRPGISDAEIITAWRKVNAANGK